MRHEDYIKLTKEEKTKLITKLKNQRKEIDKTIIFLIEDILYPILKNTTNDIEEVTLDPTYEYNDEGYSHSNIMPFINGSNYEHIDLMDKIDASLEKVVELILEPITIDVQELKIKFQKNELENTLIKKHVKKQNKV
jgi:hypothetical protein